MQPVLKFLLVDDEEIDRMSIESFASGFPQLHQVGSCNNAIEAYELINRFSPDIIFADIEMPGLSGLELVRRLSGRVPAPVFITSHPEFALEGFELDVFDYLLKPVSEERFARCVQRLIDFFQLRSKAFAYEKESEANFIVIKQGYDRHRIQVDDILFLEAMKDYTRIVTGTAQYLVLCSLSGMEEKLVGKNFARIHRSYIVNCNKVSAAKGNKIQIGEKELPVGKLYKKVLDQIL